MKSLIANRMQGISPFYVMELLQRAKQLEQQGRDIIHMEIGEPDFATPDAVIGAAQQCLQEGQVKYTAAAGLPALREAIAGYYKDHYQVNIAKERIFVTPGASGAFLLALGVSLNGGEEILMADPCYPCNDNFVRLFEGKSRFVNVTAESRYQLNAELIRQHWRENCKGAVIASPSNPTGTVIEAGVLKAAIEQTRALQGCFYSDEIYHGLVYGQPSASALQYSDEVFVINSFSKFFGMTGWRIGWLVAPEAFIDPVERLAQNLFIATSTHSQYAALASFSPENTQELERRRREFAKRRDFLYENLLKLGFIIDCKPEGAFYIYANCSRFSDDSFRFAKELLESEGVAVTPGKDFGKNNDNFYIRFAYTASIDRMADALNRLERFLCR
ncbi:pyridoxal phosphate-dependent aminotransferase [Methylomarinum sp. Ch1-1]|uniref:Aminotransferase n=1 Tax=Methylomarinum roseum TaxID=3067653 RepID=A0AAU7NQ60_9GAMM|nr:pyridoxal phosphate-dependent aminotransferase [Methylomarinum sp. Ch1-1]MDP4520973.1 pyridoxal phosphate-dependent aminotransferase [Methylomarinum sp. Ch1-1]